MTDRHTMTRTFFRILLLAAGLALAQFQCAALATDRPAAIKYKINPPPAADLHFAIAAKQSGFAISGNSVMRWRAADGKFTLSTETRAMLVGKILDEKSEG